MIFIQKTHDFLQKNAVSLAPLTHIYAFKPKIASKPFAYIENFAVKDFSTNSFKAYQITLPIMIEGIYREEEASLITQNLIELLDNADFDIGKDYHLIYINFASADYKYSNRNDIINIRVIFNCKLVKCHK